MLSRLIANSCIVPSGLLRGGIAKTFLALLVAFSAFGPAGAADPRSSGDLFVTEGPAPKRVTVVLNKSRTFNVGRPFARAIVGSNEFADVLPLSDRAIYIQGKRPGTTNVSLFDGDARLIGVLDLEVTLDSASLQERVRATGGGTQGIRVSSTQGQVVLSGTAVDAVAADRAMSIAKSLAGDQPVVNAMQVAPSQQVSLEVRFIEVNRSAGRELGINLVGSNTARTQAGSSGFGAVAACNNDAGSVCVTPGGLPIFRTLGSLVTAGSTPFGSYFGRIFSTDNAAVDLMISALEQKGLARRLAEPTLIALSGDTARFVAGGEFPVPIVSTTAGGVPTVAIQFKEFGVKLNFTPIVLSRGVINLKINPEVSELDASNAVTVAGTSVPALVKREAMTTVELRDGQTFAVAGLLQTRNRNNIAQLPWIGSVPVLGALFRSAQYQQEETDLVIIVTPRLIAPIVPGQKVATPFDSRLPSNDVDFFLMGQPDVKKEYTDYVGRGGELKGPYGHMIQPELATPNTNKR